MKAASLRSDLSESFNSAIELIVKLEKIMCRFSERGLEDFISIPEIALLLLKYLSSVQNKRYRPHYERLRKMAEKSIACSRKSNDSNQIIIPKNNEEKVMKFLIEHKLF